jgi:hypothetical protein
MHWLIATCRRAGTGKRQNRPGRTSRPLRLELLETRDMPSAIITTVAGQRAAGFDGNGGPAIKAHLDQPSAVTTDSKGDLYIIDDNNNVVREVTPNGIIKAFAGGAAHPGGSNNNVPATQAWLSFSDFEAAGGGLAVDNKGDVFIADPAQSMVYKVTPNGIIHIFAGGGSSITGGGDGGPATQASLLEPYAVDVDSKGDVFIADTGTNTVREVTPNGIIHTVAGMLTNAYPVGGPGGFKGDGGRATLALLNQPTDVAVDGKGDLFIVDSGNDRIREVTPNGIINTIVGNGKVGYTGNGGRATAAELNLNREGGIAVDPGDDLFIADSGNNVIRKVTSGIITTVAGTVQMGYSGNGGPAAQATLNNPTGVTISSTAVLYFSDTNNNVVRAISGLPITKAAQTIAFAPLPVKTYGNGDFALSATASSGLAVTYTATGNATVYLVGGVWKVHITGAGSAIITAHQAGNKLYNAAANVSRTLTINKAAQTITFAPLPVKTFGNADFALSAAASSGLAVTYTATGEATVYLAGGVWKVHITGAGSATITAHQVGNSNYNAATNVSRTLTINKAAQPIPFALLPVKTYGDADSGLSARASSDLAVTYTSTDDGTVSLVGSVRKVQ